jgi:hypothetical protein
MLHEQLSNGEIAGIFDNVIPLRYAFHKHFVIHVEYIYEKKLVLSILILNYNSEVFLFMLNLCNK